MADHGSVEYATAQGNDVPTHEVTYERFVHLVFVAGAHIVNILLGLAIGAVQGHWVIAFGVFVIATLVAAHGLMTGTRALSAVMVGLSLVALALGSAGGPAQ
jgi:uncharacterized membrane protein